MTQMIGAGFSLSALEMELAAANLSLYVQMTPAEELQMDQVLAAMDRLERFRTEVRGLRTEMGRTE